MVKGCIEKKLAKRHLEEGAKQAFRCIKSIDLQVRPIRHRIEAHVCAHVFLACLPTTSNGI